MRKYILWLTFFTISCGQSQDFQCNPKQTNRKLFNITVVNTSVECCYECSDSFMRSKYPNRTYLITQDSIKVYGFGYKYPLTLIYQDTLGKEQSLKFYNFLRSRRIDTLDISCEARLDHYCMVDVTISGDSLPNRVFHYENCFESSFYTILFHIDRLITKRELRMYHE